MKASALEFRLRYLIHLVVFVLGFTAPWNRLLHLDPPGPNALTWGLLSVDLTRLGLTSITSAFNLTLVVATLFAFAAAFLRTWGTAYLGNAVVHDGAMHSAIRTAGPYRFTRNPLYLGTLFHAIALGLLMPASGAIFTIVVIAILQIRLILAEEAYLTHQLGPAYLAYSAQVPRFFPTLRPRIPPTPEPTAWPQAFLGEAYMWGVALSYAALGYRYNGKLLIQAAVVSFGVSLIARAFPRSAAPDQNPTT